MRALVVVSSLVVSLVLASACFPDRTLNKACTNQSPCVIEGDVCVDGVCRRGLPIMPLPNDDAGVVDASATDAGDVDAGATDAESFDTDAEDAGVSDASTA
jgi:hypothetical protein